MRLVVLGEENLAPEADLFRHLLAYPKLLAQPQRHRQKERAQAPRRVVEIGFKQPLEFQKRLVVEGDVVEFGGRDSSVLQAELDGARREAMVMLLAREALFLRGGQEFAVAHEARRGVVVVGRDAKDVHASLRARDFRKPCSLGSSGLESERLASADSGAVSQGLDYVFFATGRQLSAIRDAARAPLFTRANGLVLASFHVGRIFLYGLRPRVYAGAFA